MMSMAPLSGTSTTASFAVRSGSAPLVKRDGIWAADVSPEYFATVGTHMLRGQDFSRNDLAGDPVCIISANAAATFFGRADPLDQYIYPNAGGAQTAAAKPYCRVIGIAEEARWKSISDAAPPVVYRVVGDALPTVAVRAANSALAVEAIRSAARAVAPHSLVSGIEPVRSLIDDNLRVNHALTLFAGMVACLITMILGIGVFGVLALEVSQRTREIGIQIALGAGRAAVSKAIFRKLRTAVGTGLVLGSICGLLGASAVASYYGLPVAFAAVAYVSSLLLLLALMLAAAAIPLRRALAISPVRCLAVE
jgi:hypothetical protein